MTALAVPATWVERRGAFAGRHNGGSRDDRPGGFPQAAAGIENGASRDDRPGGFPQPAAGIENGSSREDRPGGVARRNATVQPVAVSESRASRPAGLDGALVAFAEPADVAVRRSARTLHAACAELLPGYSAASREPWRQALLTAGCLDAHPRRPAPRRRSAPPLIVEDVVQPSDVLCALWLARRCGLFSPGSPCGDGVGLRSACEIIPSFAPTLAEQRRAEVLETLRANTAWRAHQLARAA
jgi:hypothetical protein